MMASDTDQVSTCLAYSEKYSTDLLEHRYCVYVRIEHIPPSRNLPCSRTQQRSALPAAHNDGANEQLMDVEKKIRSKTNQLKKESSEADIMSLMDEFRSSNLGIDINRLTRFAIYRNALTVVKYLVAKEQADLTCLDIYGRSAIFYAVQHDPNITMLRYIESEIPATVPNTDEGMGSIRTPLYYAVKRLDMTAAEFFLASDADPNIKDDLGILAQGACDDEKWSWAFDLLFGFKDLLKRRIPPIIGIKHVNRRDSKASEILLREVADIVADLHPASNESLESEDIVTWWHIPWTNGIIAFALFRYIARQKCHTVFFPEFFPYMFKDAIKVPDNAGLPYNDPLYKSNLEKVLRSSEETPIWVAISLPCLVIRLQKNQLEARTYNESIRHDLSNGSSRSIIQSERTLDEAYFPSLPAWALHTRNKSQVVSREWTRLRRMRDDDGEAQIARHLNIMDPRKYDDGGGPILMVSQLWLWAAGDYIISSFPADDPMNRLEYRINPRHYNSELYPMIRLGLAMAYQVSEFGKPQANGVFPATLDIFETSVVSILSEVDEYMEPDARSRPDMQKEYGFMFRIADIREELAMIQDVLVQQLEILDKFIDDTEEYERVLIGCYEAGALDDGQAPMRLAKSENWERVKHAKTTIEKYQKRATRIDGDADRIDKRIQDQLNLKRTHASINDARVSLVLGTAVIGFTVITIIFAPLAFVTALFALPLDILLKNQFQFDGAEGKSDTGGGTQSTGAYTTRYVGTWFAVAEIVSLVVTVFLVVLSLWFIGGTENLITPPWKRTKETPEVKQEHMEVGKERPPVRAETSSSTSASEVGVLGNLRARWSRFCGRKPSQPMDHVEAGGTRPE